MVTNQHTGATRKKLREAEFFLRLMASVDRRGGFASSPEAAEFYFSAFVSAARAVGHVLKSERTEEWNAWIERWEAKLSSEERELYKFFVEKRNTVLKKGWPGMVIHVSGNSAYEFQCSETSRASGVSHDGAGSAMFATHRKSLVDRPDVPFFEACLPFYDLTRKMVEDFEHDNSA